MEINREESSFHLIPFCNQLLIAGFWPFQDTFQEASLNLYSLK